MFNEENYKLSAQGLLEILHLAPVCASFAARSLEWVNFMINHLAPELLFFLILAHLFINCA